MLSKELLTTQSLNNSKKIMVKQLFAVMEELMAGQLVL
jgi:hypothetical protein